jgi:hypothetical protein
MDAGNQWTWIVAITSCMVFIPQVFHLMCHNWRSWQFVLKNMKWLIVDRMNSPFLSLEFKVLEMLFYSTTHITCRSKIIKINYSLFLLCVLKLSCLYSIDTLFPMFRESLPHPHTVSQYIIWWAEWHQTENLRVKGIQCADFCWSRRYLLNLITWKF